jgi:hypothetical protein
MTIKTSYLTLLGFHVNSAIDSGNYGYITLDDVRNNIEAGSIFEFLENEIKADTGLWSEENKAAVIEHWQSLNNATIAESDFHVSNNGLNLILAYILEELQAPTLQTLLMDYDYDYLWEKFSNAVDTLASGTGNIQTRLADATIVNLLLFKPEELPDDIRHTVLKINERLTSAPVSQMSDYEASEIATEIMSIYDNVTRHDVE